MTTTKTTKRGRGGAREGAGAPTRRKHGASTHRVIYQITELEAQAIEAAAEEGESIHQAARRLALEAIGADAAANQAEEAHREEGAGGGHEGEG